MKSNNGERVVRANHISKAARACQGERMQGIDDQNKLREKLSTWIGEFDPFQLCADTLCV